MTSTSTIRTQAQFEGHTVRDVVEYRHELVNEVWCRKILRQVLQSLELQHAAGMPHRAITPDTIVMQENGEPMLLPSDRKAAEQTIPADLHALACVIHYAITLELAPEGPLRGRGLAGYSDSLTGAIDRCLAPDPARRPQTIDELRNLLGIVSLGPPVAVASAKAAPAPAAVLQPAPAVLPPETAVRRWAPPGRLQRWLLIGLAALVLLAAAMALLALLRGTAARDAVVLTLPPQGTPPSAAPTAPALPAPVRLQAAEPPYPAAAEPTAAVTAAPVAPVVQPAAAPSRPAARPAATPPARTRRAEASAATTSYKLVIKPWASVYVDGVERGVSPPLKRLSLPAGQHTVRLVNPNFPDRVIRVDAGRSQYGTIVYNFAQR